MTITDSEKARRRSLLKTHYDAENNHDMDGIMATFAPEGEMVYSRIPFTDTPRTIAVTGLGLRLIHPVWPADVNVISTELIGM